MYMNEGMDTGDIILKQQTNIGENETTGELWSRLSKMGANLLVETLKQIEKNIAPRTKQPEEYTLAPMLDKQIAKINWNEKTARRNKKLSKRTKPNSRGIHIFKQQKNKILESRSY